jgi:hypothetical protein
MGPKKQHTAHTEKKRFKCPNGTRKNNKNECVDSNGNVVLIIPTDNVDPLSPIVETAPEIQIPDQPIHISEPSPPIQPVDNKTRKKRAAYCPKGSRRIRGVCIRTSDGVEVPEIVGKNAAAPAPQPTIAIPMPEPTQDVLVPPQEMVENDNCKTKRVGMNAFLAEKERAEHKEYTTNPIRPEDARYSLYPDLNDPAFHWRIASRKEFQETKFDETIYDIKAQSKQMCESKFELMPHQLFVKNFLSIHTPYNGLLLYHGLGTGKTCTAIGVAEETRKYMAQMGIRDKIIVVASPNVQGNFRRQLFNESKLTQIVNPTNPEEYTWNIETCVGDSLLKEIDPNSVRNVPREKIVSNIQAIINTWYEFMGYGQLANYITQMTKVSETAGFSVEERKVMELRKIRNVFSNKTIIIDEVHNITQTEDNKHKTTGALLLRVAKYATNMRLLLLSATPMFDTYKEIIWLVNLLNTNDKRSQIDISDVFDSNGNIKEVREDPKCGMLKETGRELLIRKLTGYVSYVRGENPYTFPFRVYPDIFAKDHTFASGIPYPEIQMNDKPVTAPLKHIKVYLNDMPSDSYQRRAYRHILNSIKYTAQMMGEFREANQFDMLQKPIECLNIVYPNDDFEKILGDGNTTDHQYDGYATSVLGETGLNSIINYTEKGATKSPNIEYKPKTLAKYGRVFSPAILPKYSRKMSNICDIIRKTEGIVLIYSQYIDGGVVPMALALEEMGFAKHSDSGERNSLFRSSHAEPLDAKTMLPRSQVPRNEFQQATYIMITGNRMYSPNNTLEVAHATRPENRDGSKIKVILISKAGSEGLDFSHIRQIHIMEPWFNMNRIEQIIGRGVRNLSHCGLPFEKRNVQIYLHSTLFEGDKEEPADLYIYRIAEGKALQIGKVTRLLKSVSVDCVLNVNGQNNMTAEQLITRVENQRLEVELSTKERVVLRVGDQPYTDICDYMDNCEYQCRGTDKNTLEIDRNNIVQTQYSTDFAQSNLYSITKRIRDLFREQSTYKRDQLIRMVQIRNTYPIEHIFYTLSLFIENPQEYLVDKYGRIGYLVNRGEYYTFQPNEITDEQTTTFERTMPVHYARSKLYLELPKEIQRIEPITLPAAEAVDITAAPQAQPTVAEMPREATTAVAAQIMERITELHAITRTPLHEGKKPKMEKNWYRNCVAVRPVLMEGYAVTEEEIAKYITHHIMDEMLYSEKMALVNYFYGMSRVDAKNEYERMTLDYLEERMFRNVSKNKWGVLLVNKNDIVLSIRSADDSSPEWILAEEREYDYFKEEIARKMVIDKSRLNQIIGYITQFKDNEMTFKYKDITMLRNKVGARCDSAGKADTLKLLNMVVETNAFTHETTETLFQPHLCVLLEMLLRKFTQIRKNGRIYFLTPEQCVVNEITKYSTG